MGYRKISYFRQLWYVVKYAIYLRYNGSNRSMEQEG